MSLNLKAVSRLFLALLFAYYTGKSLALEMTQQLFTNYNKSVQVRLENHTIEIGEANGYNNGYYQLINPKDQSIIYSTQSRPLVHSDFNNYTADPDGFVLSKDGQLAGYISTESLYPSSFYLEFITVTELKTGRTERVSLTDANKSFYQALKKQFPQFFKYPGALLLKTEIHGFQDRRLVFSFKEIAGTCMDLGVNKDCPGMGSEYPYPPRFGGYWAYQYNTGVVERISWDSQAKINAEHRGFAMK